MKLSEENSCGFRLPRVVLGMSGGVDSSYAAKYLRDKGFDVLGVTLLLGALTDEAAFELINEAKKACTEVHIEHFVLDLRSEFKKDVIAPCLDAWKHGRTPNPCVLCNPKLKFHYLNAFALEHGADFIATGHYARSYLTDRLFAQGATDETFGCDSNEIQLSRPLQQLAASQCYIRRAVDLKKDQSYFLYALDPEIIKKLIFPLGYLEKPEVRKRAAANHISAAAKADSQEICFLQAGENLLNFLDREGAAGRPGPFLDTSGQVIGRHLGIGHYTVGQRKKLGQAFGKRMTVLRIDYLHNAVVLGDKSEGLISQIKLRDIHLQPWFLSYMKSGECPVFLHEMEQIEKEKVLGEGMQSNGDFETDLHEAPPLQVKVRSQGKMLKASFDPNRDLATLAEPSGMISPGQSVVFYLGDFVAGGGVIA